MIMFLTFFKKKMFAFYKSCLQVVGLTASIGAEKAESISKMEENVLKICSSLDAECISMVKNHQEEMKSHVAIPKEGKYLSQMSLD